MRGKSLVRFDGRGFDCENAEGWVREFPENSSYSALANLSKSTNPNETRSLRKFERVVVENRTKPLGISIQLPLLLVCTGQPAMKPTAEFATL